MDVSLIRLANSKNWEYGQESMTPQGRTGDCLLREFDLLKMPMARFFILEKD